MIIGRGAAHSERPSRFRAVCPVRQCTGSNFAQRKYLIRQEREKKEHNDRFRAERLYFFVTDSDRDFYRRLRVNEHHSQEVQHRRFSSTTTWIW